MRSFWNEVPLLRVALALIAGILLHILVSSHYSVSLLHIFVGISLIVISVIGVIIISSVKDTKQSYRYRFYPGTLHSISLIVLGFLLAWMNNNRNHPDHFSKFLSPHNLMKVIINTPPQIREKTIYTTCNAIEVIVSTKTHKVSGALILRFMKDSSTVGLKYGDMILIHKPIKEIEPPKNPQMFNLRQYLGFRNLFHEVFLFRGEWKLVEQNRGNKFLSGLYRLQHYFVEILERYVKNKDDLAVASSILLGYRDYMSTELTTAYAATGVLHVLSVSGLHVGIVFLALNWLLGWMDERGRKWQLAKSSFIILFIWFYALITGFSPAVLRSAAMFTGLQIGKMLTRPQSIYNTIAASIVVLLVLNPYYIADIGFQLSYIAVIGIVYLQPKISSWVIIGSSKQPVFRTEKTIFRKAAAFVRNDWQWLGLACLNIGWQTVCLSIAAQLATTPLSVYYFHQFPNLFLITNLVILPASNVIIYVGPLLIMLSPVGPLAQFISWMFNGVIHFLNQSILYFESVPHALWQGISISFQQMLLLYALLLTGLWFIESRKPKVFISSLIFLLLLLVLQSGKAIERFQRKEIIVYSVPKSKALAFISGEKLQSDIDYDLRRNQSAMMFHLFPHWWFCGAEENEVIPKSYNLDFGKLYLFEGKKVLIVDSDVRRIHIDLKKQLKIDALVICNNRSVYIEQLLKLFDFREVVFDSSNHWTHVKEWNARCVELGLKTWDTTRDGAYVYNAGE